jgi:hypothetical protein
VFFYVHGHLANISHNSIINDNIVRDDSGTIINNRGYAVYASSIRYRNTATGFGEDIDTTTGRGLSANGHPPFLP